MSPASPELSIVVPLFNEVENARPLLEAIQQAVEPLNRSFEVLLVDDGSTDGTVPLLRELQRANETVRVIAFRRNFGQTAAMRAGICAAQGQIIVTLDGDLQNDPRDIPKLVAGIDEGQDLVLGWRKNRKDPALSRTLPSRLANAMIGWITGVNIHDAGCSLKAYRAEMIKGIPLYSEMHRFIPAMSTLRQARISEQVVNHFPRQRGVSKYGLSRIGKVLLDVVAIKMLISFRHQPLRYFVYMALPLVAASAVFIGIDIGLRIWRPEDVQLVRPMTGLLFLYLAVHMVFVGLLAELVVRVGIRPRNAPQRRIEYVND